MLVLFLEASPFIPLNTKDFSFFSPRDSQSVPTKEGGVSLTSFFFLLFSEMMLPYPNRSNDYEKEIPRLLDAGLFQQLEDMPRATSAPPHLQDRLATVS